MEMGTGKTRVALAAAKELGCARVLVVTPLSVVHVWAKEAELLGYGFLDCTRGTIKARAGRLTGATAGVVVVGYESYWREPLRKQILALHPDMVIYDEGHRLQNRRTKQSRFAHYLVDKVQHRLALTGTPMPNGPEDLFSLYKAIRPDVFGGRWQEFEWRYIIKGGYLGYQVIGYRNQGELQHKVAESSYRITKAEALDLPEQIDVPLPVRLISYDVYHRLRKKAIAEVRGLMADKPAYGLALSQTVLTNVIRLQQIASGWVKVEDGRIIDLSREKEEALLDLVRDGPPKIVVFCRFRHDIDRVASSISHLRNCLVLDGRTPVQDRGKLLEEFRTIAKPSALVVQVAVGSLGIDLSCASVAIFYSLDFSLSNYLQSRDRLHRIGQVNKVTYYCLLGEATIDEKIYQALQDKWDLSKTILDKSRALELFA